MDIHWQGSSRPLVQDRLRQMAELPGRCRQYRQATLNFMTWLSGEVPPQVKFVDDVLHKAKQVSERGICFPSHIYDDLCICIRVRQEVHHMYTKRTPRPTMKDRKHEYMISVLKAARKSLRATRSEVASKDGNEAKDAKDAKGAKDTPEVSTPFGSDSDEDSPGPVKVPHLEIGMLVRLISAGKLVLVDSIGGDICKVSCKGEISEVPFDDISQDVEDELPELYGETLCFQAVCFLLDLQEIEQEISNVWEGYSNKQCSLLAASAVTNFCVLYASSLAHSLEVLHRDLSSIERIVVAAYLLHVVQWVQQELRADLTEAMDLVTALMFGDNGETIVSNLPHTTLLAMARVGYHDGTELKRAREILCKKRLNLSIARADQIIDLVSDNCGRYFFHIGDPHPTSNLSDDFLVGKNAFLHTSGFLFRMKNAGVIGPPKIWNFLKPNHFGPQWEEEMNPAPCTTDLTSYFGAVLPALLWYAHYEHRTSPKEQLQVSHLKFDTLMPLWPLLQEAIKKRAPSFPLAFAMHAMLLSLVKVNGDRRCKRIAVTTRASFEKFASQLARDQKFYENTAAAHNMVPVKFWVDEAHKRSKSNFREMSQDPYVAGIGILQRDYAMLLNPWVAGQQQLVAVLAVAIGFGSSVMDGRSQIRFVLHLYNALRCAQVLQPLEMMGWLMRVFADSKAIWHAGRPEADFLHHWFLSLGMAVSSERGTQRKLVPIDPEQLSCAYRRACANNFSDLPERSRISLRGVLDALRSSFNEDIVLGANLLTLGAHFRTMSEELVDRLNLHKEVLEEQARRQKGKAKKDKKLQEDDITDWFHSANGVLASKLLLECDEPETVEALAAKHGYKATATSKQSPLEKPELLLAAEILTAHVAALHKASYTLPC